MRSKHRTILAVCLLSAVSAPACIPPDKERLNSTPQGYAEPHHSMASEYAYHNDQAMLADMSIADIHFLPHSPQLSATGQARLERYAELLATSGGTVHYDPTIRDEALINARVASANVFLNGTPACPQNIHVALGLTGGRGMTAAEASAAKGVAKQPESRNTAYHLSQKQSSSNGSK